MPRKFDDEGNIVTNRRLVYIPEINPHTFLFFYFRGDTGRSYSFREYQESGNVIVEKAEQFPYTVDEIDQMAKHVFNAPTHNTGDYIFWRQKILKRNRQFEKELHEVKPPSVVTKNNQKLAESFIIQNKQGNLINSVDQWFEFAPPKGKGRHWKDGRSAKELAKEWFKNGKLEMPHDLKMILESHPVTSKFVPKLCIPEYVTKIDEFPGEQRNNDMIISGTSGNNNILITIEAKADESFGQKIGELKSDNPKSNRPERIRLLMTSIFGRTGDESPKLMGLRYQLLTAIAGTIIEAHKRKSDYAVFIVHTFISDSVNPLKIKENEKDFEKFIGMINDEPDPVIQNGRLIEVGQLIGGKYIPNDIPLLVGKIATAINHPLSH